jgi:PAS domain S-box-containing protein
MDEIGELFSLNKMTASLKEVTASKEDLEREIAERQQAESRLQAVMESSPDPIFLKDRDSRFLLANPATFAVIGKPAGAVLGKTDAEFYDDPATGRAMIQNDRRIMDSGRMEVVEESISDEKGTRVFLSTKAPYCDPDGQVIGLVGVARDITERKRAEQALRASENRLRKLVEGNIIGVDVRDAAGRLKDANSVFLNMVGYSTEELQAGQLSIKDLTAPAFWPADQQAAAEALASGACQPYEKAFIHKDGHIVPAMVGYTRLDDSGDEFIGFVLDLSELKQTQAVLQDYTDKLEQSNRELEQFAFVASHDLQEPLRKIKTFGSYLQQQLQGSLDENTRDGLQRMLSASERMQAMIDDLLQLSRVNTQGRPFVPVDLAKVAAEVVSDLEPRILRTGGQVVVEALPCVEADPIQIHQVLQNLIGNGLKFHKPGTPPIVKVSGTVTQSRTGRGELVSIQVADNGIGFEEARFEKILQPFQRLHVRSEYEGTGIGLAIVKKIVERHHGEISAHSTPGEGSTFLITLPVRQAN